jgi:hypothetical protein
MTRPAEQRDDLVTLSGRGSYRGDGGRIPEDQEQAGLTNPAMPFSAGSE